MAKEPANKGKTGQRDSKGRFVKGQSGNPNGRPSLPPEFKDYARDSAKRLREIADDPGTPVKVKADIERWFAEMYFGKAPQALDVDGKVEQQGAMTVKFEGKLEEWSG
jgi:hypothetical protein